MAGGFAVGIPLKPKHQQSKQILRERCKEHFRSEQIDEWEVDFAGFEAALSEKTRMLILNSPHNPVGKVFTQEEIERLGAILEKYPRVVVVEDNVYENMTFDDMFQKELPKLAFLPAFRDRTLSVYSGGKIFAATGSRLGWVIGAAHLIKCVRSVHQYNVFCGYSVVENAAGKSLEMIADPSSTYMRDYAEKLSKNRDLLLEQLIGSKFDFDLWVPKGGYFVIADISRVQVAEKYFTNESGKKVTKDFAFCFQLAHEEGVVAIPCSPFYAEKDAHLGEKYVRFAFCKDESMIKDAGKRMKQ